jgi:hypothetical protein
VAATLTAVKDLVVPPGATEVTFTFAQLQSAANEADKNKDAISFRIESVLSGELLINGASAIGGVSLLSSGGTLTYRPAAGALGRIAGFTIRAFDGRVVSAAAIQVNLRVS